MAYEIMERAERERAKGADFCGECGRKRVWRQFHFGFSTKTGRPVLSGHWRCPSWWCRFWYDFKLDPFMD